MIGTNVEQFLSQSVVGNYILSPGITTHQVEIFQTQQAHSSNTPP